MITRLKILKAGILTALRADTLPLEVFQGMFAFGTGVLLAFSDHFNFGAGFSEVILYGYLDSYIWSAMYISVGIAKVYGAVLGSTKFRQNISLVALYMWLTLLYYLSMYVGTNSTTILLYSMLSVSSVFAYLSLWRFRWI